MLFPYWGGGDPPPALRSLIVHGELVIVLQDAYDYTNLCSARVGKDFFCFKVNCNIAAHELVASKLIDVLAGFTFEPVLLLPPGTRFSLS